MRPNKVATAVQCFVCRMWAFAEFSSSGNLIRYMYMYIYIYMYIYSRYHTITDVCTTTLLPTKPSLDDDSGFRHGFGSEASLPLAQSAPAVSHDTTRLCQIVVTLWDCHIHTDAVRTLSWIFFHVFPFVWWKKSKISQGNGGWAVNKTSASDFDRKYICYPAISETLSSRILIFFQLTLMCPVEFFSKGWLTQKRKHFCFNGLVDVLSLTLLQLEILSIVIYIYIYIYINKVDDLSRGWPEGSLFDSYYTKV